MTEARRYFLLLTAATLFTGLSQGCKQRPSSRSSKQAEQYVEESAHEVAWDEVDLSETKKSGRFDLSFTPKQNATFLVTYRRETQWGLPQSSMKGKIHAELLLRWRILSLGSEGKKRAKADFLSVLYRGAGQGKKKPFNYDLAWSKKKGYEKGKDGEADRKWIKKELGTGIALTLDNRGTIEPGAC